MVEYGREGLVFFSTFKIKKGFIHPNIHSLYTKAENIRG